MGINRPGKPMLTLIESFNEGLRDELLNETLFTSLAWYHTRILAGRLQQHTTARAGPDGRPRPCSRPLPNRAGICAAVCRRLHASSRHSRHGRETRGISRKLRPASESSNAGW